MDGERIFDTTLTQWRMLLDSTVSEAVYHSFLSTHAGQFFCMSRTQAVVISKLKLGASYETDFVVVEDAFSDGILYTFVEIEVPHAKLFTKGNRPSNRLNTALSQVNAWRQWLETHRSEALDLLPSYSVRYGAPPNYRFMVIMGRRTSEFEDFSDRQAVNRAWLGKNFGISIRSFDYLTSIAEMAPSKEGGEISLCPPYLVDDLLRRDWSAISHHEWVKFIQAPKFHDFHLYQSNWEGLLRMRGMEGKIPQQAPNPATPADA